MAIKFNDNTASDLKNINFNGNEVKKVDFKTSNAGTAETVWVKPYMLTASASAGADVKVACTYSDDPDRKKQIADSGGSINITGNRTNYITFPVFYGDKLTINYSAISTPSYPYTLIGHSDVTSMTVTGNRSDIRCWAQPGTLKKVNFTSDSEGYVTIYNYNYVPVTVTICQNTAGYVTHTVNVSAAIYKTTAAGYDRPGTNIVDCADFCTTATNVLSISGVTATATAQPYNRSESTTGTVYYKNIRAPEQVAIYEVYNVYTYCYVDVCNPNPRACQANITIASTADGTVLYSGTKSIPAKTKKSYSLDFNTYPILDEEYKVTVTLQDSPDIGRAKSAAVSVTTFCEETTTAG